jgi:hypothetical protein
MWSDVYLWCMLSGRSGRTGKGFGVVFFCGCTCSERGVGFRETGSGSA